MLQLIKKNHWVIWATATFILSFLLFRSCEDAKKRATEQSKSDSEATAKENELKAVIELKNGLILASRFKEQRIALDNQRLKAEAKKLPTAMSFKKTRQELDTTKKEALEKDYEVLWAVDSSREVLLNKSLAVNDSLITEVEKEHVSQDSKDSTCIKLLAVQDSIVSAQKKTMAGLENKVANRTLGEKILGVVAGILLLISLAK
jgi:hypothetical protein